MITLHAPLEKKFGIPTTESLKERRHVVADVLEHVLGGQPAENIFLMQPADSAGYAWGINWSFPDGSVVRPDFKVRQWATGNHEDEDLPILIFERGAKLYEIKAPHWHWWCR